MSEHNEAMGVCGTDADTELAKATKLLKQMAAIIKHDPTRDYVLPGRHAIIDGQLVRRRLFGKREVVELSSLRGSRFAKLSDALERHVRHAHTTHCGPEVLESL